MVIDALTEGLVVTVVNRSPITPVQRCVPYGYYYKQRFFTVNPIRNFLLNFIENLHYNEKFFIVIMAIV